MVEIVHILDMLDWNMPIEIQFKGRLLAKENVPISNMLQPLTPRHNKNVWENCALIISDFNDDELEPHLVQLLEWLQDLNWPGSATILNRLKVFSSKKLRDPFINCFFIAKRMDNHEGEIWLDYLSELLDNSELTQELPIEVIDDLKKRYHNWGMWDK